VGECSLGSILVATTGVTKRGSVPSCSGPTLRGWCVTSRTVSESPLIGATWASSNSLATATLCRCPGLGLNLPRDVEGNCFQRRVWQALRREPRPLPDDVCQTRPRIGAQRPASGWRGVSALKPHRVAIPCHRAYKPRGRSLGLPLVREATSAPCRREARPNDASSHGVVVNAYRGGGRPSIGRRRCGAHIA